MPPKHKTSARETAIDQLDTTVHRLAEQVIALNSTLDAIREDLQWVTQNGIPKHRPSLGHSVLKRMAADPTADDWSERLEIAGGPPAIVEQRASVAENAEILKLRRLLASLVDCPELSSGDQDQQTLALVAEARQLVVKADQLAKGDSQAGDLKPAEASIPNKSPRDGKLF